MAVVVTIRDWDKHFECAQSRKVAGPLTWFPMPTKHDGKSFRRLMIHSDGPMVYAAWVLILAVAAKCPHRGRLADLDGPLTAADLELKTGFPATLFDEALKVLSSKDIAWVVVEEWEPSGATGQDRTGQDRTTCCAGSSEPPAASEPPVLVFPTVGESSVWKLTADHVVSLREAFPHLDVLAECKKALAWCKANERQRKTPRGMSKFLFGWMSRSQNRQRGGEAPKANPADSYREVESVEFKRLYEANRFKVKPRREKDGYWYGQLYDGGKVKTKA